MPSSKPFAAGSEVGPSVDYFLARGQVRRQARAVVELLRRSAGLAGHFLFMEDDFLLCPHGLQALAYATSKAHAYLPGDSVEARAPKAAGLRVLQ